MLVTVTGGACNKSCHWHLNFTFQKLGPGPWPGVTVPVPVPVPESESESDWKQHEAHRGWKILWPAGVLKLSFVSLSLLVLAGLLGGHWQRECVGCADSSRCGKVGRR